MQQLQLPVCALRLGGGQHAASSIHRVNLRVSGANGSFSLFQDDGKTYAYEKGTDSITKLTWDDVKRQFKYESAQQFSEIDKAKITVAGK